MLEKRLIGTLISSALVIATLFVFPSFVFLITVGLFILVGLYEFYSMMEKKGIVVHKYFGLGIGLLIPCLIYWQIEPSKSWELACMVGICLFVFLLQFTRRETAYATIGIAITLFGIFYVSWFFSFLVRLYMLNEIILPKGRYIVFYLLIVTKMGDVAAYLIGSAWGKHSLIPRISPKKSVEGAISALIMSILCSLLFSFFWRYIPWYHFLALGVLLGVLAQIGDLSESLIKRDCNVKDSGDVMPGLGGVLDMIDSLLFTAPVLYFYIRIFL